MNRALPPERLAWLAWLPVAATALFYALPSDFQSHRAVQFFPQALAYAALLIWRARNTDITARLGLQPARFSQGLRWGLATGLVLGTLNVAVILWLVPALGHDITFLRDTPHARIPAVVMLPWCIVAIAVFVEVNFRGFLLGRFLAVAERTAPALSPPLASGVAVAITALTFSFDPFLVVTFQHLHWIAVWDGLVWGVLWLRLRNLYAPIIAHAVEVMVMYLIVRAVLA
ncbi:MAG: CPBP family glutamic-type intramembrane protease [bacterium]